MLYSVRDACARDFEGTLREVAGMGFEGVELFDLHGHEPAEVAGWLKELGLEPVARHALLEHIEGGLEELAAEARTIGWRRLNIAWVDPAQLGDETLARIAAASEAVRAAGLELGYHNHDAEVKTGFLDRLPEGVAVELDAGWAWWAGADPVELLGRGPLVHIKDFRTRGERSFCPVGDGAVGYARVAPAAADAGAEWLLVEQDEAEGSTIEAARRSLAALNGMLGEAA
jgi:sugar phosphate isomerase/epimerase